MEFITKCSEKTWKKTKLIINIVITIVIVIITCYTCYIPFISYNYLFTWHVVFGAISYLALMPISLMIFDNSVFGEFSRKKKSWIHGIIVGLATIFAGISFYFEYHRKEVYKVEHFESYHAKIGLISVSMLIFANFVGLIIPYSQWIRENVVPIRPVIFKLMHNHLGQISYIIGIISICFVLYTAWFLYYSTHVIRIVLTILIIVMTLWSLVNSFISQWHQIQVIA